MQVGEQNQRAHRNRGGFWRLHFPVALVACLGLTLTLGVYASLRQMAETRLATEFDRQAGHLITALRAGVSQHLELLFSLRAFYDASEEVTRTEFETFVQEPFRRHRGVQALEWIPQVPDQDRATLEAQIRSAGYPGFQITERNLQGQLTPAASRSDYFPVTFVYPYAGNETALGYDLASDPRRTAALDQARDTGALTASGRIRLVQETGDQYGVLIFLPVYQKGAALNSVSDRRAALVGFVLAVYRMADLAASAFAGMYPGGLTVDLLDDSANPTRRELLVTWTPAPDDGGELIPSLRAQETNEVGGRSWTVRVQANSNFLPEHYGLQEQLALSSGLLLTLLLTLYLRTSLAKTAEIASANARLQEQMRERERVEKTLRISEARFGSMLATAPNAILSFDQGGTIILFNQGAERIFCYSAGEVLGQPLTMLIPAPEQLLSAAARPRLPFSPAGAVPPGGRLEITGLRQSGEAFPAEAFVAGLRVEGADICTVILHDISESRRAQAALRESEARFQSAFDHAPIGMALLTTAGRFVKVNHSLCEMFGRSGQELLSLTLQAVTHPEDRDKDQAMHRRLVSGQVRSYGVQGRFVHPSGPWWGELHVSAVLDGSGQPLHLVAQIQNISDRKRFEEQLLLLANQDALTSLPNRRRFQEALQQELAVARRYGSQGAVMFLDLDDFKYVNDSLGHSAGDEVLIAIAHLLNARVREPDVLARLGGDEFAILLPRANGTQARVVAERVRTAVEEYPLVARGHGLRITTSIGVTVFPDHGGTAEELLSRADQAMYRAKAEGGNRHVQYDPQHSSRDDLQVRQKWEDRIRQALASNSFVLHAQPVHNLITEDVRYHELLLRLPGDGAELIFPGEFLGVAERFGLIREIDRWVVRQAIRSIAHAASHGNRLSLAVNLSRRACGDPDLPILIQQAMAETGADPGLLVLEITETAVFANLGEAQAFISLLRRLGCKFALDDFGAGYSSFSHLKHLEVDFVKIDGTFVEHLPDNPVDQHLVRAMVEVSQTLGKVIIAEFVSDYATVQLLKEFGVDCVQGFFIGRPIPLATLMDPG